MADRPEIMMPVTPAGAVEQMLLEELRRTREALDRFSSSVGNLEKTMAVMGSEQNHVVENIAKISGRVTTVEDRTDKLEAWRDKQSGAHGLAGWLFNSPLVGWLAAAGAVLWAALSGKGHP